jgi:hypothetical protein
MTAVEYPASRSLIALQAQALVPKLLYEERTLTLPYRGGWRLLATRP